MRRRVRLLAVVANAGIWVAEDVPTDGGPPYSMLYRGGIEQGNLVCGLGPMAPQQVEAGMINGIQMLEVDVQFDIIRHLL